MKLLHIADLHIGKRVNEFNMIEEQKHILEQVLRLVDEEKTDGVLIAGDVYDKSQPPVEAVELLDAFLTGLTERGQAVFMISGNHDSPERLGFGSRLLRKNGLYIAGVFEGRMRKATLRDEHGAVNIFLLPFIKPAVVKPYFETAIESYDQAVRMVTDAAELNPAERNILLAHQFVISGTQQPERSDSESVSVGGLDHVDAAAFDGFDYVALGHLHRAQRIGRDTVRYAGSPLKYSFSEARHAKSVTVLELGAKGQIAVTARPLAPLHDLREIKGPIAELLRVGREDPQSAEDYIHVTLTDEGPLYDAIGQLRQVYPNLMLLDFENSRSRQTDLSQAAPAGDIAVQSPLELFAAFYEAQNNSPLRDERAAVMERVFAEAGGDGE
ncbi:MAG: exonuclease SbcCD subunit D [Intestinibacillus sp.]